MKSNLEVISNATTLDQSFIAGIIERSSAKDKKTFSSLAMHYRKAVKNNRGIQKASDRIMNHIHLNSQVIVISPRNRNSEISVNMVNLDEHGMKNLKLVTFLLNEHYFLASNALALIGGLTNVQSFMVTFNARFRTKGKVSQQCFFQRCLCQGEGISWFNSRRCAEDLHNLKQIIGEIEL